MTPDRGRLWFVHPWFLDYGQTQRVAASSQLAVQIVVTEVFPIGVLSSERGAYLASLGFNPPAVNGIRQQLMSVITGVPTTGRPDEGQLEGRERSMAAQKSAEDAALSVLRSNRYLTLATSDERGPWAAPLAYVWMPNGDLVWYSATDARHSRAGLASGTAAAAIFDSTASSDDADGVQLRGEFAEVEQVSVAGTMDYYYEHIFADPIVRERWRRPAKDFVADAPQRFYRLRPVEAFVLDPTSPIIDRRRSVDLQKLYQMRSEAEGVREQSA